MDNDSTIRSALRPGIFSSNPDRRTAGFTLVEAVLLIVFLGVGLLASLRLMSSSIVKSADTELLVVATNLANEKMEMVFADKRSRGYPYLTQSNYPLESNVNGNAGFTRRVTITDLGESKRITVTVTHPQLQAVSLVAELTNY